MAEIYQLPDSNSGNAGMGNIPFSIPIGGFGGGWGSPSTGTDYLKKTLEEDGNKNDEQVYAIPTK